MTLERMVRYLLHRQILQNPLPWRVERDWAYEVIAFNGVVIAKCQKHEEAEEIIAMAEKMDKKSGGIDDWPTSPVMESIRDRLALPHEERCKHPIGPLGLSGNMVVNEYCIRPKGHSGPHKGEV